MVMTRTSMATKTETQEVSDLHYLVWFNQTGLFFRLLSFVLIHV